MPDESGGDFLRHIRDSLRKSTGLPINIAAVGAVDPQGNPLMLQDLSESTRREMAAAMIEELTAKIRAETEQETAQCNSYADDIMALQALIKKLDAGGRDPMVAWTEEERSEYERLAVEDCAFFVDSITRGAITFRLLKERHDMLTFVIRECVRMLRDVHISLAAHRPAQALAQLNGMDWDDLLKRINDAT